MPFELFNFIYRYMPRIGHMDWIGFGSAFRSSLWIGLDSQSWWIGLDWM